MLFLPAGIVMRFIFAYSATTYLHEPSFRDSDFLPFHAFAAFRKDALLSLADKTFFTRFACAEYTILPFILQIVTTRTEGLIPKSRFTADLASMAYDLLCV